MKKDINLISVALLFVALIAASVGLIGIYKDQTSPWVMLGPLIVGVWSILTLVNNYKNTRPNDTKTEESPRSFNCYCEHNILAHQYRSEGNRDRCLADSCSCEKYQVNDTEAL